MFINLVSMRVFYNVFNQLQNFREANALSSGPLSVRVYFVHFIFIDDGLFILVIFSF